MTASADQQAVIQALCEHTRWAAPTLPLSARHPLFGCACQRCATCEQVSRCAVTGYRTDDRS